MHQPDYRVDGVYLKPWTWLHALKDYSDMAAHLETIPGARAVINFSPVLIEQLQDYPRRIRALLERGEPVRDSLLDALGGDLASPPDDPELLASLLRVNANTMKDRFPPYARLFEKTSRALAGEGGLRGQDLSDLLVWYVLVWLGESLRELGLVRDLTAKAAGFSDEDRRALLSLVAEVIGGLLPRYRALSERGKAELSVTPYAHPILPLLLDFESARDATPEAVLPEAAYPGGEARCDWHLKESKRVFTEAFGVPPAACWPSEGGLSEAVLRQMARHGFTWTASGSRVLHNSLAGLGSHDSGSPQLDCWRLPDGEHTEGSPAIFFRDDALSDLIGFEYAGWESGAAVDDFIARLEQRLDERLASDPRAEAPILGIIMDGENAWEYYPENGWPFLQALYTRLAEHPRFRLITFSRALERRIARPLASLCAGSWVRGDFSTWIGQPAKNRAWELLIDAKSAVDAALEGSAGATEQTDPRAPGRVADILRQLAVCEASDWFWWLGGDKRLRDAPEFDAMFRRQLAVLYRTLGMAPPVSLEEPIDGDASQSRDHVSGVAGAMQRSE